MREPIELTEEEKLGYRLVVRLNDSGKRWRANIEKFENYYDRGAWKHHCHVKTYRPSSYSYHLAESVFRSKRTALREGKKVLKSIRQEIERKSKPAEVEYVY